MPPTVKRKVHAKTPIADDLEVHISVVTTAGRKFLEVRNYIPSLKQYGRGITLPSDPPHVVNDVIAGLLLAKKS
jgi:hypothetical protein